MISFTVDSEVFARGVSNALAFIPAGSRMPNVYFRLDPGRGVLEIVGTDSYAVGLATVPVTGTKGPTPVVEWLLTKGKADTKTAEGAAGVERTVRMAGKGPCDVSLTAGRMEAAPMGGDVISVLTITQADQFPPYRHLVEMLGEADKRPGVIPGVIMWDWSLASRFAKVKADKATGRMGDLLFGEGPLDPVLVKIGTEFRGLIMPIDREVNAENIGSDGLW
ncbi:hypothetical protein [Micromonospora avicenniae]|uniref:hypothetical protein n=1 Tax=Micromonospora avicenniae TaxID=1198245 RepID=UPI00332997C1